MKDDGKLSRKPESESYMSQRNVIFLVYRSPCVGSELNIDKCIAKNILSEVRV